MILKMIEELANPPVAARPAVVLAGMVALLSADALTECLAMICVNMYAMGC